MRVAVSGGLLRHSLVKYAKSICKILYMHLFYVTSMLLIQYVTGIIFWLCSSAG